MTCDDAEIDERRRRAREKLFRQIQEQGIKPLTTETLRAMGRVWPEDEDPDDFLRARERWRREALPSDEKGEVMQKATSWLEDGLKQGRREGMKKGVEKGR
jgi:hypothetical protein